MCKKMLTRTTKQIAHEALDKMYNKLEWIEILNDKQYLIIDAQRELGFKEWAKEKEDDINSERNV